MIIRQAEVLYQFSRSVSILVFKNENENEIKSHFDIKYMHICKKKSFEVIFDH